MNSFSHRREKSIVHTLLAKARVSRRTILHGLYTLRLVHGPPHLHVFTTTCNVHTP
jgi:hypothetical protein